MDWRGLLLGTAFVAMWSSAFTSARIVVADAPPFLALSLRFLASGLIALAIGWALGQRIVLSRRQWAAVAVFGICQNALYLGLNFQAMQTIDASVAVVIASLLPLMVAGMAWIGLGERLSPMAIAGLVAGFAGVIVIMSARIGAGAPVGAVALCGIGVLALAVATLIMRGTTGTTSLWIVVGLQMLVGCVALFPVSLALETWEITWTWPLVIAFVYTTLVPGVAATMIWFVLVGRIGATRAATFHFLNPFIGLVVAAAVLGETVTSRDLIGVAIIMAGILAVQVSRVPPSVKRGLPPQPGG